MKKFNIFGKMFFIVVGLILFFVIVACEGEDTCNHHWYNWVIKTSANLETAGVEERYCGICNITETRSIPILAMPSHNGINVHAILRGNYYPYINYGVTENTSTFDTFHLPFQYTKPVIVNMDSINGTDRLNNDINISNVKTSVYTKYKYTASWGAADTSPNGVATGIWAYVYENNIKIGVVHMLMYNGVNSMVPEILLGKTTVVNWINDLQNRESNITGFEEISVDDITESYNTCMTGFYDMND